MRRGPRRVLMVALTASCLVAVAGIAGYWWYGDRPPEPPVVDLAGRDPEIVEAIESAQAKIRKSPRLGSAWGRLGMLLLAHDFEVAARTCLAEAERLDPKEPRWPYLYGRLVLVKDPEAALPYLRRAAERATDMATPRLQLAEVLLSQGHTEEAETEFQRALTMDPRSPRAHLGLGQLALERGDLEASLNHFNQTAMVAPGLRGIHALLAEVHRRRNDPTAEARELALLNQSKDGEWPDPFIEAVDELRVGAEARIAYAKRLLANGRGEEAAAVLTETAEKHPNSAAAELALGRALAQLGNDAAAETALREAARRQPDSVLMQSELGQFLQRQGNYQAAAECYGKAIALQPTHALSHYNLANCKKELGDRSGAVEELRTALRCKPEFAEGHKMLGRLLVEQGEKAEAVRELEQALRLDPGDSKVKELLEKVR